MAVEETVTATQLDRAVKAEERLAKRLEKYAGEWVAVREHEIVAHAESLELLLGEVDGETFEGIFQVPEPQSGGYFF